MAKQPRTLTMAKQPPFSPTVVLLALLISYLVSNSEASQRHQACPPADPSTDGTQETFRGQDVIWQIPSNPKSILFLAHGSDQEAFMFFDRSPRCSQCFGLPETRIAVLDALKENYAVVALQSINHMFESWPLDTPDLEIAVDFLQSWSRNHSLDHLPVVAWGFSSGGYFISSLALRIPIRSLVFMCSSGTLNSLELAEPNRYPPSYFLQMITEPGPAHHYDNLYDVAHSMSVLTHRGVPVVLELAYPKVVTPEMFTSRIQCIAEETAKRVCVALRAGNWLNPEGFLTRDPWFGNWRAVMMRWNGLPYCEEFGDLCLAEQVEEELKVASSKHWFTSDYNAKIFAWLRSGDSSISPSSGIAVK